LAISEALLRAVGLAAFLTVALGALSVIAGVISSGLDVIQLGGDPAKVRTVVHDERKRRRIRRHLWLDYGFILSYWLTFVGLAVVLARLGGFGYDIAALAAAFAATVTALLDVLEDLRTNALLALARPGDQIRVQPVEHLQRTALAKWLASGVTIALLSLVFVRANDALQLLGIAFLLVAVLAAAAVAKRVLLIPYLLAFFALGLTVAFTFTFYASDVLDRL
jgi:hypothetical protein